MLFALRIHLSPCHNYAAILNQEKLCNNSKSGNAQTCFYRYCGVKVSRADFELYNNGEELLGTRMLELILYHRNSIYNKGDYCKLSRLSYIYNSFKIGVLVD